MEPKLLQTFTVVCQAGTVANAANRLGLTQPAVSKRIAALEKSLGTLLFQRIGVRLSLNEAGKKLQPIADEILSLIELRKNEILELDARIAGDLHIACSHHIALYRLPDYLKQFYSRYPEVNLHFDFTESETAYRRVQNGRVDLALLTLPANISSSVHAETLWIDQMQVMVAKTHPVYATDQPVDLETLIQYPAVLPEKATFTMSRLELAFQHNAIQTLQGLNANNMETIRMLIECGLGWGVLPETMQRKTLIAISSPYLHISRTLGCAWHKQRPLNAPARAFIRLLPTSEITASKGATQLSKIDH